MTTRELEIKHIAPYLPYELRAQIEDKTVVYVCGICDNGNTAIEIENVLQEYRWVEVRVTYTG